MFFCQRRERGINYPPNPHLKLVSLTTKRALTTSLDKKTMVPVAQSRQILEHHETIGRQGLKYFGTYHLDCFQIKATSDRKALTRISNPLH